MIEQFLLTLPFVLLRRAFRRVLFAAGGIEAINSHILRTRHVAETLRQFGASIDEPTVIHSPLVIHNARVDYANLKVGRNVHIGRLVILDLAETIEIGADATLSMGATVLTHADVGDRPLSAAFPRRTARTRIGHGCWVGANATILAGCDLGEQSAVGAGAVVTRAVPPHGRVVGVPAVPLGPT